MSILAQATSPTLSEIAILGVFALAAIYLAKRMRLLQPGAVAVGPERLAADENAANLWFVTAAGFGAWLIGQSLIAAFLVQPASGATRPTTQLSQLSTSQLVTVSMLGNVIGALTMLLMGQALRRRRHVELLGIHPRLLPSAIRPALIGALIAIPITFFASGVFQWFWSRTQLPKAEEHEFITVFRESTVAVRVMVFVSAAVIAPMFEELLFRGHVQTAVRYTTGSRWVGIVVASLLFGAVHITGSGSIWMVAPLAILAVCLGFAYERTGNLWVPIGMHALFNAISLSLTMYA